MIPDKVKALFQFIEYLHSNIENFNKHNDLIKELEQLDKEKKQLKPRNSYKDKQQYDKVQVEIKKKFNLLQTNTASLIKAKATELNVCSFENEPNYSFNGVETEIRQLKKNFSNEDLPEIFRHKSQYLEYRSSTHDTFLSLQIFFDELDKIAKSLFDYFKDTEQNEFEAFEIKAIPVNSIAEAIQGFKKGQTKFTLSNNFLLNTSTIQQQPKTDYWQDDAEEITLIAEYQKAVNKLVERGDTGCFPMRFRMLPRVVLNENKYSLQRKKYLLKQMRLVLDEVKNTEIGRELFTDLYERIEPYADIFRFVFSETPLPPQPIVKQKPEQETPKTFDELFYNTDLVKPCIDILKELDPPLIDTDYNFIGKLKGIVCVWIDELQRQGIVKHYSDRKIFASLIPQKIKRFSIDESMFGKYQSKAEKNYRTDIKTMVSKIKLSQNSH